ncbi:hypothetical protein [uncultured Roseobacter sp.]|uniref:hypothetical protein n=1 Tax=uncultured Roseobacter sp. TaxID=114847 RepID=UPI00261DEC8F|nr:hypothetical protein [uncultured Roseobacter sp.]
MRGGRGTAIRAMGLLADVFPHAIAAGIINQNPTHSLKKPRYKVLDRRLSEVEYQILGGILRSVRDDPLFSIHAKTLRMIEI